MRFETRIANTQGNASNIADLLENELAQRVIYIRRAHLLIGLARDAQEVMRRAEAAGVESDFNDDWHALRSRLAHAQRQFENIIGASDVPQQPCKTI